MSKTKFKKLFNTIVFTALSIALIFALLGYFGNSDMRTAKAYDNVINFQGLLRTPAGENVSDGNYQIVFRIYSSETGGSALWSETHGSVYVHDGIFNVNLGETNPINLDFSNSVYYLGIRVGSDSEMTPRAKIGGTVYSLNSEKLGGYLESEITLDFVAERGSTTDEDIVMQASLRVNGLLRANGQVLLGDGGDTISVSGTAISITSNGTNSIKFNDSDGITFSDSRITSAIPLSLTADTAAFNAAFAAGNRGIVDALISLSGGAGGQWTITGTVLHPTVLTNDIAIGGNTLASALSVDVDQNTLRIGDGATTNSALNMYSANGSTGSISYIDTDAFSISGSSLVYNGTLGTWTIAQANSALTQTGTGQITFTGNLDATNGIDVTGASFTVNGNFSITTAGVINQSANQQVTFAGNIDANNGVDITGANLTLGGNNITGVGTNITANGALTVGTGGQLTLGDGGDTIYINSSDWDISTTGDMTGIGNITADGNLDFAGAQILGASPFVFEGATNNDIFSTFVITDPTGLGNTITFQDASGTVAYLTDIPAGAGLWTDANPGDDYIYPTPAYSNNIGITSGVMSIGTTPVAGRSLNIANSEDDGYGIYTAMTGGSGSVYGNYIAVSGATTNNIGVFSSASASTNAYGFSSWASGENSYGIYAGASSLEGGKSYGGYFYTTDDEATPDHNYGVYSRAYGAATTNEAFHGEATLATDESGVYGFYMTTISNPNGNQSQHGVYSTISGTVAAPTPSTYAIYGTNSINGNNLRSNAYGVYGESSGANISSSSSNTGVYGVSSGANNNYGGSFRAAGVLDYNYGVYSTATGATTNYSGYFITSGAHTINYGIYATASGATTNWAGYFGDGNVNISNTLHMGGTATIYNDRDADFRYIGINVAHDATYPLYVSGQGYITTYLGVGVAPSSTYGIRSANSVNDGYGGSFTQSGGGTNSYGIYGVSSGSATNRYGGYFSSTSASAGTNYGIYATASGATTNWAGYFGGGDVYIANHLGIGVVPTRVLHIVDSIAADGDESFLLTQSSTGSGAIWNYGATVDMSVSGTASVAGIYSNVDRSLSVAGTSGWTHGVLAYVTPHTNDSIVTGVEGYLSSDSSGMSFGVLGIVNISKTHSITSQAAGVNGAADVVGNIDQNADNYFIGVSGNSSVSGNASVDTGTGQNNISLIGGKFTVNMWDNAIARDTTLIGVWGTVNTPNDSAVYTDVNTIGVYADATALNTTGSTGRTNYGIYARAVGARNNYAGYFITTNGSGTDYGIYAKAEAGVEYGVYIDGGSTYGLYVSSADSYFNGNVVLGGTSTASKLYLYEPTGSGTNYTSFSAQAQGGNIDYILPSANGSAGSVLSNNGSGTLSWTSTPTVSVSLSSITAATAANTINNVSHAQTWQWNSLTTGNALTLSSSSATSGKIINISSLANSNSVDNISAVYSYLDYRQSRYDGASYFGVGAAIYGNAEIAVGNGIANARPIGIRGRAIDNSANTTTPIGVWGDAIGNGSDQVTGLYGSSSGGLVTYGLYASASGATTNWAGYFGDGNVNISNTLHMGGTATIYNDRDADFRYIGINVAHSATYPLYVSGQGYITTYLGVGTTPSSTRGVNVLNTEADGIGGYFSQSGTGTGYGVYITKTSGTGGANSYGLYTSNNTTSTNRYGGYFYTSNTAVGTQYGIYSRAYRSGGTDYGVYALADRSVTSSIGVYGQGSANAGATGYGGYFLADGTWGLPTTNYGIYASATGATTNWAGYFASGNVYIANNVGLNTTGPDRRLDILDASNPQMRLTYTDGSVYTDFQTNSSGNLIINPTGDSVIFGATGNAISLIPAEHNTATAGYTVGTSASRWKAGYFVDGVVTGASSTTYKDGEITAPSGLRVFNNTEEQLARFSTDGSVTMPGILTTNVDDIPITIDSRDGILGVRVSASRFKQNITNMEDVSWIYDLTPRNFEYKSDPGNKRYGLIAEEVATVNNLFAVYDAEGNILTVRYENLISPMIKVIQEQKMMIDENGNVSSLLVGRLNTAETEIATTKKGVKNNSLQYLALSNQVSDMIARIMGIENSLAVSADAGELVGDFSDDWNKVLSLDPKLFETSTGRQSIGYLVSQLESLGLTRLISYDSSGKAVGVDYNKLPIYLLEIDRAQTASMGDMISRIENMESKLGIGGDANTINGDLSVSGIVTAKSIVGLNNKWSIDQDGNLFVKSISTEELKIYEKPNGSAGSGTIEKGSDEFVVENLSVIDTTKVVVTFENDYAPATRYWIEKDSPNGFKIKFDTAVGNGVSFNYFLIQ